MTEDGGWFADPSGRFSQRFFDGRAWTASVVAANGSVVEDALPDSARPMPPGDATGSGESVEAPGSEAPGSEAPGSEASGPEAPGPEASGPEASGSEAPAGRQRDLPPHVNAPVRYVRAAPGAGAPPPYGTAPPPYGEPITRELPPVFGDDPAAQVTMQLPAVADVAEPYPTGAPGSPVVTAPSGRSSRAEPPGRPDIQRTAPLPVVLEQPRSPDAAYAGESPYGYGEQVAAPASRTGPRLGLAVAALGFVLVLLSLVALNWADGSEGTFLDLGDRLREAGSDAVGDGIVYAYGVWLDWVMLVATAAATVLAARPPARWGSAYPRVAATTLAGAAAVLQTVTITHLFRGAPSPQLGAWLGVAGYLLLVVGLVLGPGRRSI